MGKVLKVLLLGNSGDFDNYAAAAQHTATLFSKTFDMSYNPQNEAKTLKNVRKGDLVKYPKHMTIICSDRPTCPEDDGGMQGCNYEIIRAYGWHNYKYPNILEAGANMNKKVFSRKAIATWNNITANPIGFGRLMLWD